MPKRKRGEPGLDEKIAQWKKELARAIKLAKGFERQRMSKRIRDADPSKKERIEREIAILKSIDLHQAAHAHLCSSLLKIKGIAESPKLPSEIQPIPRPTDLSEDQRPALHNVTSALCNRKQVKDIIDDAIVTTCMTLRVPMPEKKGKAKGKKTDKDETPAESSQPAGKSKSQPKVDEKAKASKNENHDQDSGESGGSNGSDADDAELTLLKRKRDTKDGPNLDEEESSEGSEDGDEFEGFSDSDAEERAFSRYDDLVGDSSDDEASDEEDQDDLQDSRNAAIRRLAPADDMSLSSDEDENDQEDSSEDDDDTGSASSVSPSPKRAKSAKIVGGRPGESAFIPTLMGGYISGSESASDVDVAPPVKKNRRGQRARQAIWEAKYGDKAKHKGKEKSGGRDQGWDLRRGAVGGDEDGASSGPWKKGITNPFEKRDNGQVHPDRQRHVDGGRGFPQRQKASGKDDRPRREEPERPNFAQPEKPKAPPKRDDTGPLHPSWAAAKKSKDEGQKVAFQGKKVTFD